MNIKYPNLACEHKKLKDDFEKISSVFGKDQLMAIWRLELRDIPWSERTVIKALKLIRLAPNDYDKIGEIIGVPFSTTFVAGRRVNQVERIMKLKRLAADKNQKATDKNPEAVDKDIEFPMRISN